MQLFQFSEALHCLTLAEFILKVVHSECSSAASYCAIHHNTMHNNRKVSL